MKYNILHIIVLLLPACATPLSPEAKSVRSITPGVATVEKCQHLGMVSAFGPALFGGVAKAQKELRTRVAAAGGNAFSVSSQTVNSQGHADIIGDAYRCP